MIYDGFAALGIYNIGFCIILFTLVVRMLMLPMTIKQQKATKLNAVMQPEIQAIQKKYQNKKDQQSQMAMNDEVRAVYDKYGTSMTGGCLQLVIQMPILLALYRVIMNVPAYVQPVKDLYSTVLNGLSAGQMKQFFGINKIAADLSTTKFNQCIDAMANYTQTKAKGQISLTEGTTLQTILDVADKDIASRINHINNFLGFNLSMSPKEIFEGGMIVMALVIPILAGLFQFLSVQLTTKLNGAAGSAENPMANSMKTMNYFMPLMSVVMCFFFSTGIGVYWVAGSLVMMLQQIFINMHLKKIDVQVIIDQNKEKAAKKAEKRKAKEGIYRERVLEASKVNARNVSGNSGMSSAEREEKIRKAKEAMGNNKGSIASRANMVSDYNKRNDKK